MEEEPVDGKVDWRGRRALKHKHGGTKVSLLILAAFAFENMATLSLGVNLVSYFNVVMHYELADAANMVTNYAGVSYILSIVVAILADTWIGRYKSVLISGFFECLGLALLTVQAHYTKLKPPTCNVFVINAKCEEISGGNKAFLFISLYLLAFGSAGLKASLPSHGADQFDERDPKEARQMSSFFNGLLLAICVGGAVSLTFNVWIQDQKGWDWGFGISTIAIVLAIIIFAFGLPLYRIHVAQRTNCIIEIMQDYQCVYLLLHPTPQIVETSAHCCNHFGYRNSTPYMPHLSLLYGDLTDEEKQKAQERANILDDSLSGLSFQISRLALYKTDTEDKTLKSWEKIAECTLSPN